MIKSKFLLIFLFGVFFVNAQSIKINSLKINKKVTFFIDFDKLKTIIKIDSITPIPELMDMSTADSLIYIGNSYFTFFKETNSSILESIIFDDKVTSISLNSFNFDKNITLESVKKIFIEECSNARPISIYGDKKEYLTCSIDLVYENGKKSDYRLLFFFFNTKLKRIDLWEPS